ncbi:MAG: DUF1178 family protein [Stappiaceae bacterium]
MIHFALTCQDDHSFEGWFRDSSDFDKQIESGFLLCPFCGSPEIRKALMAPAVSTSRQKEQAQSQQPHQPQPQPAPPPSASQQLATVAPQQQQVLEAMRAFRNKIAENADDVGNAFAEEARKMHYGESERRGIYGQAETEEVEELRDEGVEFFAMPSLPEEKN